MTFYLSSSPTLPSDDIQFPPEGDVWYGIPEFNLLAHNLTVPGFSPLYPDVHCTADGYLCQLVTGESGKSSLFPPLAY